MRAGPDTNAYDVGVSQMVQDDFYTAAANLEAAITRHDADVAAAMSEYEADEVSDAHRQMEKQWTDGGNDVKEVIQLLRTSLSQNDEVAVRTIRGAMKAIPT